MKYIYPLIGRLFPRNPMIKWIPVKEKDAPPMQTVLLSIDSKVFAGGNEATQTGEDASYCSWELHETSLKIQAWAHLPEPYKPKS